MSRIFKNIKSNISFSLIIILALSLIITACSSLDKPLSANLIKDIKENNYNNGHNKEVVIKNDTVIIKLDDLIKGEKIKENNKEEAKTKAKIISNKKAEELKEINKENKKEKEFSGITLVYTEGDLIKLSPKAIDPDNDVVTYKFSKPFNQDGVWKTKIGDAGTYYVKIIASDGKAETEGYVRIILKKANRPPVINCKDNIILKEGDLFKVSDFCNITDEDNEKIVTYYKGWPGYSIYRIKYDEAGIHKLTLIASDGINKVNKTITIKVVDVNRPPYFPKDFVTEIKGVEGDLISIDTSKIRDDDGDNLRITFTKPFNQDGLWQTKIGDAGTYHSTIIVSDGVNKIKKVITIKLAMRNTRPVLEKIPTIKVKEGETIKLPIKAYDRENDPIKITVSGWFNSTTYKTSYDDAGIHTVTVTASDGKLKTKQIVTIIVEDVNRPPVFVNLT